MGLLNIDSIISYILSHTMYSAEIQYRLQRLNVLKMQLLITCVIFSTLLLIYRKSISVILIPEFYFVRRNLTRLFYNRKEIKNLIYTKPIIKNSTPYKMLYSALLQWFASALWSIVCIDLHMHRSIQFRYKTRCLILLVNFKPQLIWLFPCQFFYL